MQLRLELLHALRQVGIEGLVEMEEVIETSGPHELFKHSLLAPKKRAPRGSYGPRGASDSW